ncbi:unnamed protein product [Prorocentrum cordatum]|uniref:F-box domain-containing protein n=1 Tax=Prorocentrum cordatum TaxID=2364126 RepID=A0ABN9QH85_9DINO|nr:unnamed protein product [Polarella glacialis]
MERGGRPPCGPAGAGALGECALQAVALLAPRELHAAAGTCRQWRRLAAHHATTAGPSILGPFARELEADSVELCRRAAEGTCAEGHFELALVVATEPREGPLDRAMQVLRTMPRFVALPPDDCWDGGSEQAAPRSTMPRWELPAASWDADASVAAELRRQWAGAYLGPDGELDGGARSLCLDVVARWRALWGAARCAAGCRAAALSRTCVTLRRDSLRGTEWWCFRVLGVSLAPEAGAVSVVSMEYFERNRCWGEARGRGHGGPGGRGCGHGVRGAAGVGRMVGRGAPRPGQFPRALASGQCT